jgi:hypothetical protein
MTFIKKISEHKYDNNVLFSQTLKCKFGNPSSWKSNFLSRNYNVKNELNSSYFRSDEFSKVHKGLHILFAGCSYTWGEGVEFEDTWSKRLHRAIKKDHNVDGYYNIGTPGSSISSEVFDIFKYIYTYGKPDIIFLNMPDCDRFYYSENKNEIFDGYYKDEPHIDLIAYQNYFMLDIFCKENNIKLFSFSWDHAGKINSTLKEFNSFYFIDAKDIEQKVFELSKNYKVMANDNMHLGEAYHKYWSDFIYGKFAND